MAEHDDQADLPDVPELTVEAAADRLVSRGDVPELVKVGLWQIMGAPAEPPYDPGWLWRGPWGPVGRPGWWSW